MKCLYTPYLYVLVGLFVGSTACSDGTLSTTGAFTGGRVDSDAVQDVDETDLNLGDLRPSPDVFEQEGEFLAPCETDTDCLSRYCIQRRDDNVCTELCAGQTCPDGWNCATLQNTGSDAVRLCVPNPDSLCRLCDSNSDCGGLADMCLDLNGQTVCGQDCTTDPCPAEYVCNDVVDLAGNAGRQCVPAFDRCSCPEVGATRPCVSLNEYGICEGSEVCQGRAGWSACTAFKPAPEACDGLDNNCDGMVDENLEPRACFSEPNAIGTCEGTDTCSGTAAGWSCSAPAASIELCDGLDNDCNGTIDDGLCFDGNPCTNDVCDAETDGCFFVNRAGPCDDGNLCTENTVCIDGACDGTPKNCDDGNPCTTDRCEPGLGCQHDNADGAGCEIGNFCTADTCQGGVCIRGPAESCPGSSQCTATSCDPAIGCTTEPLSGIGCSDGDDCTINDFCSNGRCIEGTSACAGTTCQCPGLGIAASICVEVFGSPSCICAGVCP